MLVASSVHSFGGSKTAITGDFVLLASEVTPIMKALRGNGMEVTAVHNHMLTEDPRLLFMHFWANDDALKLAKGFADCSGSGKRGLLLVQFSHSASQNPSTLPLAQAGIHS
jgi:hypothetical protein